MVGNSLSSLFEESPVALQNSPGESSIARRETLKLGQRVDSWPEDTRLPQKSQRSGLYV